MNKATLITKKRWDRSSRFFDFFESGVERRFFSSLRKDLINNISGRVLEVGVGTGKNLEYYNKKAMVIGIDISSKMLARAKKRAEGLTGNFSLVTMDAQNLEFEDKSFDYVLCTFVLCSVPDPIKTLKEMKRVCKRNGKIIMIEHVLSDNWLIALFQHIHNPFVRVLFGPNINRRTVDNVRKAGLKIDKEENVAFFDVFKKIEVKN